MSSQQPPECRFTIERASRRTTELPEAMSHLVPQLSLGRMPPSEAELTAIPGDDRVHLFIARSADGVIQGAVALVFYRVQTSLRARIEDLVVFQSQRGLDLGKALEARPKSESPIAPRCCQLW